MRFLHKVGCPKEADDRNECCSCDRVVDIPIQRKFKEYDVTFSTGTYGSGRFKVTAYEGETAEQAFRRECVTFGRTTWKFESAEEIR